MQTQNSRYRYHDRQIDFANEQYAEGSDNTHDPRCFFSCHPAGHDPGPDRPCPLDLAQRCCY